MDIAENKSAAGFKLSDTRGKIYNLSEFDGKKIYIKFWATWCSICLSGLKELIKLDNEFKDMDDVLILTVVAPNTRSEMDEDKFKAWYKSQGYEFNALMDTEGIVTGQYNIQAYPTSVFISSKKDIAFTHTGHMDNLNIKRIISEMP